jgi:hypothetical protein
VRYAAKASACKECRLKCKCTNSKNGRWVSRSLEEEYLDRVRAYRETEPYRRALRKRVVWVEPLFGEAKEWHGLRGFRLRRLQKVNTEALLIASGQNVKRLLAFGSRGPRSMAQAAALRRPEACCLRRFHESEAIAGDVFGLSNTFFNTLGSSANFAVTPLHGHGGQEGELPDRRLCGLRFREGLWGWIVQALGRE